MTPEQETRLVNAIAATFGTKGFDTTDVICAANASTSTALAAAIDAAIPHARYRSGYQRGRFRSIPLRRVLKRLAKRHFDTDVIGCWYIRPGNN